MLPVFLLLLALFFPDETFAHAFGQLYTLPLPAWLYLYGGGAAVLVSFLLIGYFVGTEEKNQDFPTYNLSRLPFAGFITSETFKFLLKVLSLLILTAAVAAGYFGPRTSVENFTTIFVWIVFWLGMTYLSAILGNVWSILNPWKIIVEAIEAIFGKEANGVIAYPQQLGYLPALAFFFIFIWLELLSQGLGVRPNFLSAAIVLYTLLNLAGAFLFGKRIWFRYFEFFSVIFKLISKIAPFEVKSGNLFLRIPFVGLIKTEAKSLTLLLFILFFLSSTAFDGFRSTTAWRVFATIVPNEKIMLVISLLFFSFLYAWAIALIKTIVRTELSFLKLTMKFAYSLVPIALAYNFAHYYTLLVVQGQSIIPVISDPFGRGWNLFNTASFSPNVAVVDASFVWHSQVLAIIVGHIAAVYIAHVIAIRIFSDKRSALVSQLPMLVLMIAYTICGLWILSQPLTLEG